MNVVTVTPPAIEPVSLDEMRRYLRVDAYGSPPSNPDDGMIAGMIVAAREKVEQLTNRSFIQRRLRMTTDLLPRFWGADALACGCWRYDWRRRYAYVELDRSPVVAVLSVDYREFDGSIVLVDASAYWLDPDPMPARLYFTTTCWPLHQALRIEYIAGLPTSGGSPGDDGLALVPEQVKAAMRYEVQMQYDEVSSEKRLQLEDAVTRLLESLRVHTF